MIFQGMFIQAAIFGVAGIFYGIATLDTAPRRKGVNGKPRINWVLGALFTLSIVSSLIGNWLMVLNI